MGLLTELFRRSPGVVRSIHPTHPVAIWGYDANVIATGHHLAQTPCGVGTPFEALLKRHGKIALLGTDISALTFYHMLEEAIERDLPLGPFTDEVFHLRSRTRDGLILDTNGRLFEPAVSRRRNRPVAVHQSGSAHHAGPRPAHPSSFATVTTCSAMAASGTLLSIASLRRSW